MQVLNDSAKRAILLAKTYHNKLTTTQMKNHIYTKWYTHAAKKNSRQAEIYTTENKLS